MPIKRASKKVTKKSYRRTKRKYKKAKTYSKINRMRKYHKKYNKKKAFKRFSSVYRVKHQQGLKWTRYMSLADFLTAPNFDIMRELYSMVKGEVQVVGTGNTAKTYYYFGGNGLWREQSYVMAKTLLRDIFTVYSTKFFDQTEVSQRPLLTSYPKWKAWNPPIWRYNCGPLFDTYINMYKMFKYVGVKVSWKPNAKPVTMLHGRNIIYTTQNGYDSAKILETPPVMPTWADYDRVTGTVNVGSSSVTAETPLQKANVFTHTMVPDHPTSYYSAYHTICPFSTPGNNFFENYAYSADMNVPTNYRLWINFTKQGYESTDAVYSDLTYQSTSQEKVRDNRLKFANLYNETSISTNNMSKIRSYSLLRPFKFYVRPKLSQKIFESPENETVLNNAEKGVESYQKRWRNVLQQQTEMLQTGKKFPWISVNSTYPDGYCPGVEGVDDEKYKVQLGAAFDDTLFMNPIMFGWMLTRDDLRIQEYEQPFAIIYHTMYNKGSPDYMNDFQMLSSDYLEQLGKFKVTYYVKFKDMKTNIPNLSRDTAINNATGGNDMEEIENE